MFQRRSALSDIGAAVKRTAWNAGQLPGFLAEVNLPFVRTPSAIMTTMAEYSPIGAAMTVPDLIRLAHRATKGTADAKLQRRVVDGLTRAGIGSAALYLGAWLAERTPTSGSRAASWTGPSPGFRGCRRRCRRSWTPSAVR
jgi:hypothetical protein